MLKNCLFGTYRAHATKKYFLSITSERPATIRIDNCQRLGSGESEIPRLWSAALPSNLGV